VRLNTVTLVLDLRSLERGVNTGAFTIPLKDVEWQIEDVRPADDTGTLDLTVDLKEGAIMVSGRFSARFCIPCARCLEPAVFSVTEEVAREYVWKLQSEEDEREVIPDSGILSLMDAVREAVLLSIPGKPLCTPECPGIDYI
jgi:uncharacterized protein